jgi:hypothetical protein
MSSQVYRLDTISKSLSLLNPKPMNDLGYYEVGDLESWLASCKHQLFSRDVLWIMRQDWAADNQRSDIVGLSNKGDLVIAELKRGVASQNTITQVLAYAAEYESKTPDQLGTLYYEHSQKTGASSLVEKAPSESDAQSRISNHVGENEVNKSQILVILAEGFDDRTLAICEYLRRSAGVATFSMELWQYAIHPHQMDTSAGKAEHIFLLEQVLPPPSIRARIEAEREAAKSQKWARDPKRMEFMRELQTYLWNTSSPLTRSQGSSYSGNIKLAGFDLEFGVPRWEEHPSLTRLPPVLALDGDVSGLGLNKGNDTETGTWWLEFADVDANNLKFEARFGDRLLDVLKHLKSTQSPQVAPQPAAVSE